MDIIEEISVLRRSQQHHEVGLKASWLALFKFKIGVSYCACCARWKCDACPLSTTGWLCCDGLYRDVHTALKWFKCTGCGLRRFRRAEQALIAYIQMAIDVKIIELINYCGELLYVSGQCAVGKWLLMLRLLD